MSVLSDEIAPACCAEQTRGPKVCPGSATPGQSVAWETVAALTAATVPPRQDYWLCRDPGCSVVYFGESGDTLTGEQLQVTPGFKESSDGLLCYCFGHRRRDFERSAEHAAAILESIKAETKAGRCACEVRNPTGRCCLGEVARFVRSLADE